MILHKLGRDEESLKWIDENLNLDAFDHVSRYVKLCIAKNAGDAKAERICAEEFHLLTRDFYETYLMVARDLAESGFYPEAVDALKMCPDDKPMIHYYLGSYILKCLQSQNEDMPEISAAAEFDLAEKCDPYCCFPNKLEDIAVLKDAISHNPNGAKAYYYLGCLFYDKLSFDESIRLWEQSANIDDTYPTLLRNLSIAYYNKRGDKEKAKEYIEKAFALDKSDARVFLEMDQLYQRLNISLTERLQNYKENIDLIEKRDDLYTQRIQ